VGLALAALPRIRRRDETGTGLAIGGILASGVWTLLAALVVVLALTLSYGREGDLGDVASEQVGVCLDEDPMQVTDCSTPHDLEVYYSAALPLTDWPGSGDVDDAGDDVCYQAFEDYVGISWDDSDLDYTFFAPSRTEWNAGRHEVVCVILPSEEHLVGSVKGTGK
jgi:hypothetical protein